MSDAPQVPEDLSRPADQPAPPTVELPDAPAGTEPAPAPERAKGAKRVKGGSADKGTKKDKKASRAAGREKGVKRDRRAERRAVPEESFDFLAGRFSAAVRTRVMNLVLIAVLVLVGGTFVARAVTAGVSAANDNTAADEARQRNTVIQMDLEQRAAAGAATIHDVDEHIDARARVIEKATSRELDLPKIFGAANNLAPGARITSIAIGGERSDGAPKGDDDDKPAANDNKITLRGSIALESQAQALNAALQALEWAEGGAATLSCGAAPSSSSDDQSPAGAACTWDWTGTLTDEAYSSRSVDLPRIVARPGQSAAQGGN